MDDLIRENWAVMRTPGFLVSPGMFYRMRKCYAEQSKEISVKRILVDEVMMRLCGCSLSV